MSLATSEVREAPLSVDTGLGSTVGVTENLNQTLGGTEGLTQYFFKLPLPQITMNSSTTLPSQTDPTPSGTVLTTIALDGSFDPQVIELKKKFMFWTLKDITIVLKCVSPWSVASGTAQVFYNFDPENPFVGTPAETLDQSVRLAKSQQVSAKTDCILQVPDSELVDPVTGSKLRWCKVASSSYPRLERFGQIGVVVRGSPALGDGSSWAVTIEGLAVFTKPTINSSATAFRYPYALSGTQTIDDLVLDISPSSINLVVKSLPALGPPNTVGTMTNINNTMVIIDIGESGTTEVLETYSVSLSAGTYICETDGSIIGKFPTLIASRTQISEPVVISFREISLNGDFIYTVENQNFRTLVGSISQSQIASYPIAAIPQTYIQRLRNVFDYGMTKYFARSKHVSFAEIDGTLHQLGSSIGGTK